MSPVPPLDEKTLKSYPYFWNWIQELERDWQDVVSMGIETHIREVPSDNQWKKTEPTGYFTATLTFSDGMSVHRDGKFSDGLMRYEQYEEPLVFTEEDFSLISPLPKCPCSLTPETKGDE